MNTMRLAVLCDYREENWPSMDLVAEMLVNELQSSWLRGVAVTRVCPAYQHRVGRIPVLGRRPFIANVDRFLNRFWDYPRHLGRHVTKYDFFHLCDHSYSQMVHELPAERTGVCCHDLDSFRCLLEPKRERRPLWFKAMTRRILSGLQKAALVFHDSAEVRRQIERHGLVDPARLVQVPLGAAPEFTAEPVGEEPAEHLLQASIGNRPFLLHVGSCIPRKRIDVLLDTFAAVRTRHPDLCLVKVGGPFTPEQQEQIERLQLRTSLLSLTGLDRSILASLYRRAHLVLLPSEAEGFGIPILEALACGALVIASDLPVLREVGEQAILYAPVANVSAWVETVCQIVEHPSTAPPRNLRLAQAECFSWAAHARTVLQAYQRLQ